MLNLFVENFVIVFVAIDPIGLLPIFATFTQGLTKSDILKLTLSAAAQQHLLYYCYFGYWDPLFWILWASIFTLLELLEASFC